MNESKPEEVCAATQYIEPTILFSSTLMQIGEHYFGNEVTVSELVKKNQLLLEFTNTDQFKTKGIEKQPVEIHSNCYFSADKNQLFSSVTGYPKIAFSQQKGCESPHLHISVEPLFRITADKMKASIAIHPPLEGCHSLANEDLEELLNQDGIIFGIDTQQLATAKQIISDRLPEFHVLVIAQGKKPINGNNAHLHFEVETGPIPGRMFSDGSIDFRERKIFVPVSQGEHIATKIPATLGTPGKNVHGDRISPDAGKDISVNTLKDATYSHKTKKVTATNDGVLSVVGDTIIKVCSRQEIMSDIDFTTGHIESRNCVLIHGSVQPGFKITTDGDLEIRGAVMGTTISSQSNLVIKGGITGKNSVINAVGDADIYFIEQGSLECGGNGIIRKESYYSNVLAGGNVLCQPQSTVVGGKIIAAGNLALGNVGSANSAPAIIAAGVDGERFLRYSDLQVQYIAEQERLIQWIQLHKGTLREKKILQLERKVDKIRMQMQRLNMIPGTGVYSHASDDIEPLTGKGRDYSDRDGINMQDIRIEIHGIIFAGTQIRIGNCTLSLTHTIANRLFKLSETLTEINAHPLRRQAGFSSN